MGTELERCKLCKVEAAILRDGMCALCFPLRKDTNPKDAVGCTKPPISTIPVPPLMEVGTAMLEGGCKYARHNYRRAGVRSSIYYDAAFRHLSAWWEGEDIDHDSGIHHITKAIAGLLVLRDSQMNGMVNDDRPPRPHEYMPSISAAAEKILAKYPTPLSPCREDNQ